MANEKNLVPFTSDQNREEASKNGRKGGIASGKARRRKAKMRETLNRLLTMQVEVDGLSDILRSDGGNSTYEEIVCMAMIERATKGDVKAFEAIARYSGQSVQIETDEEEMADDGFLDALNGTAAKDWVDDDEED